MEELTDDEFDLLDELYFVQHYTHVIDSLAWSKEKLVQNLNNLKNKGYIKVLVDHDVELILDQEEAKDIQWEKLYFLATKKGLMVHNGF